MEKVTELIETLDANELIELKKNLEDGIVHHAINTKLERYNNPNKVCPVCNSPVGNDGLTLIFGPPDLKQKATFDGADCLEYFLYKIKK